MFLMNINEIKTDIQDHKNRFKEECKDVIELMLPFFTLNQKLFTSIDKMQLEKYKLSNSEVDVLITAYVSGNDDFSITPTKLQHKLLFTSGGITKVLKKLEEKDYIIRVDDDSDKRSKLVKLSSLGEEMAVKIFKEIMEFQDGAFGVLTKKEKEQFEKIIFKVLKEL